VAKALGRKEMEPKGRLIYLIRGEKEASLRERRRLFLLSAGGGRSWRQAAAPAPGEWPPRGKTQSAALRCKFYRVSSVTPLINQRETAGGLGLKCVLHDSNPGPRICAADSEEKRAQSLAAHGAEDEISLISYSRYLIYPTACKYDRVRAPLLQKRAGPAQQMLQRHGLVHQGELFGLFFSSPTDSDFSHTGHLRHHLCYHDLDADFVRRIRRGLRDAAAQSISHLLDHQFDAFSVVCIPGVRFSSAHHVH